MILVQSPDNPMPADPVAGYVDTPDGARLRFARWKATKRPVKGTVILLHGRAEYIEKSFEITADLQKRSFDVLTFDWRGQGGSTRLLKDPRRGYIDSFDQYIIDLETIMEEIALPDCPGPYYILAHSTGSLVALLAAPGFGNRIRRMVLCAPLLKLGKQSLSQNSLKYLTGFLTTIGLGETYVAGGPNPQQTRPFIGNKLTSDPDRFDRTRNFAKNHPELTIGGPTATWLFAAIKAMERLEEPEYFGQITIPTLLINAGADQVVNLRAIEELGQGLRSGSTLTIDGARHELLQERDFFREQLLCAFETFIPGTEIG
ncbi:MAG: alpha/beta hydrolase [Rhizobiaceae bacterium]|nr:alpha/beta hydrolase [Rhizobiaceae bacterium]